MGDSDLATPHLLLRRRTTRRSALRLGLLAAAIPLAAACQQAPAAAPTTAPAKPTEAAKPTAAAAAPTAAPAKPTEAAKPAAAAPAAAKAAPQAPSFNKVNVNGKLSVVIDADFFPEHNKFIEAKVREFCDKMGYPLDFSTVASFVGAANLSQKLTAAVQAGDAPDVLTHTERPSALKFLDVIEDVDDLQKEIIKDFGKLPPALEKTSLIEGKWWAVQHFSRAGGYWVRETPFKDAGVDFRKDLSDWDKALEAVLKASNPEKELYGWGLTVNRSGDGDSLMREQILSAGGQLTDESGQIVVLNKDPYRGYAIAALDRLKAIYTDSKYAKMLPPGVNSWTDTGNNEAYLAGKIFFTSNAGTMFAKAVVDKNPVANDTYLILPPKGVGPGGRQIATSGVPKRWFILKGTKNREAAAQLIRYMASAEVQREMFKISAGYVYPAYEWGWEEAALKESMAATHVTESYRQYVTHPAGYYGEGSWPGPPTPWASSLDSSNFWTDMMGEVLAGKSTAEAVSSAHARAVRVFKEFGAKGE